MSSVHYLKHFQLVFPAVEHTQTTFFIARYVKSLSSLNIQYIVRYAEKKKKKEKLKRFQDVSGPDPSSAELCHICL